MLCELICISLAVGLHSSSTPCLGRSLETWSLFLALGLGFVSLGLNLRLKL